MNAWRSSLLICLIVSGCIPVPTLPHGIGIVINETSIENLRQGETTRADVLLTLGKPHRRLANDRFLMYEWKVVYGYLIAGGYTRAGAIPVYAPHYLCLEFSKENLLVRRDTLTGGLYAKSYKAIEKCMHSQAGH